MGSKFPPEIYRIALSSKQPQNRASVPTGNRLNAKNSRAGPCISNVRTPDSSRHTIAIDTRNLHDHAILMQRYTYVGIFLLVGRDLNEFFPVPGAALASCLQYSDCVLIERNKPADCLREPLLQTLPTRCQQLKKGYGECKYDD